MSIHYAVPDASADVARQCKLQNAGCKRQNGGARGGQLVMQKSETRNQNSEWRPRPQVGSHSSAGCGATILWSCGMARERLGWLSWVAGCRLEVGGPCIRIRLQDAGAGFGAICLWLGVLGPGLVTRHPRPGGSLPSCLRDCPDRRLVPRRGGSLVHRLSGSSGRNVHRCTVHRFRRSLAGCFPNSSRRNPPVCSTGSSPVSPED
jgi:hypothetical protein